MSEVEKTKHLAVLVSFSGEGGVERMMINLLQEWAKRSEVRIDLLLLKDNCPHLQKLPQSINQIHLKSRHSRLAVSEISRYLKSNGPDVLLAAKDRAGRAALRARMRSGVPTRIVIRLGTHLSESLKHRNPLNRWFRLTPMRRLYRKADHVVGISSGVVEDIRAITGISEDRTSVIKNPVITAEMSQLAEETPNHPWLSEKERPVILGAGRLTYQKDFLTLIRAFAQLRNRRDARLIIIGEGEQRSELLELAQQLGVAKDMDLPGFQSNPYKWMANADVFVMSSRWEGSGNTLTEALALGTSCVSTNCPSGPAETLENGKLGRLVEVGNAEQMADAIEDSLDAPSGKLEQIGLREFQAEVSAEHYYQVLFGQQR